MIWHKMTFNFYLNYLKYDRIDLKLFLLVSIKQLTGIHVSVVVYMQMLLWIVLYIILLLLNLVMLIWDKEHIKIINKYGINKTIFSSHLFATKNNEPSAFKTGGSIPVNRWLSNCELLALFRRNIHFIYFDNIIYY